MSFDEAQPRAIPAHVPPELVVDFDYKGGGALHPDPHRFMIDACADRPPIFYTPANGGHWVVQRYADVRHVFNTWQIFSSWPSGIPPRPDTGFKLVPVELDPPAHHEFRRVLGPMFSPGAVRRLQAGIEERSIGLVDRLVARGRCDFVEDFAAKLPTGVFLDLLGLPADRLDQFLAWELDAIRGSGEVRDAAYAEITAYLTRFVNERDPQPGSAALVDQLLLATKDRGEPLTRVDVLGVCMLLYLAGLDTVTNTMAFIWRHLAADDDLRAALAADPARIPDAIDEFLRIFAVPNMARHVVEDVVIGGVDIRKGDSVLLPTMIANRDEREFPDPTRLDIDRKPRSYLSFGFGIHRCLGVFLAKAELECALRTWLARIPDFRVEPQPEPLGMVGPTLGLTMLRLHW